MGLLAPNGIYLFHISMSIDVIIKICLGSHIKTSWVNSPNICRRYSLTSDICSSGSYKVSASSITMFTEPWVKELCCGWHNYGLVQHNQFSAFWSIIPFLFSAIWSVVVFFFVMVSFFCNGKFLSLGVRVTNNEGLLRVGENNLPQGGVHS